MALRISRKNGDSLSDTELLERYLGSGDLDILGVLYKRYMPLVYGVCLKYFKERDEAQDAVMDIFEKLIVELERHTVDNFKSWLYVLTKRFCLMRLRSSGRERRIRKQVMEDGSLFMENDSELHPIDNGTSDKALEECIEKLKEDQMNCIRLFYYDSKCYREIAELLSMNEKTVKSHLQNAKRNLKLCLETNNE